LRAGYLRLQTHTGFVILIDFALQQWLHERASVLRCTCNAYVVGVCLRTRPAVISKLTFVWCLCHHAW